VEKEEANSTLTKNKNPMKLSTQQLRHISPKSTTTKRVTRVTSSSSASSALSSYSSASSSSIAASSMNGNSNNNHPKNLIVSGNGTGSAVTVTTISNDPMEQSMKSSYQTQHFNKFLRISNLVKK
jgi:hypothetical protein